MLLYARSLKNVCSTLGGRYRSTPRGEFAPNTLSIYAFNGSGGPEAVTPLHTCFAGVSLGVLPEHELLDWLDTRASDTAQIKNGQRRA
jgi:hypothetical protein